MPGLIMRGGNWHIDKRICGRRVCQSTETGQLEEAERTLARVMESARQAKLYGVRPTRTFEQAAAKFVLDHQHKRSLPDDVGRLKGLMPAIGAVNTGCRDAEICNLLWDWEVNVPELDTSVFIIPRSWVKNGDERVVVLNRIARSVVEARRGQHVTNVFTFEGAPVKHMLNSAWKKARARADLEQVRVHDLKHTFGRRLRAVGVSFEDRQDLLGHRSGRITSHYSAAELSRLIEAADKACERDGRWPEMVVLRGAFATCSRKTPAKRLDP
jgi:integrase